MVKKKREWGRANEMRFGDEIQPPENPESDEEARLWKMAAAGEFDDPETYLSHIETQLLAKIFLPESVKAEILDIINRCRDQFAHLPRPDGERLEDSLGGRIRLLAFEMYALARNFECLKFEFDKNGERISAQKHAEEDRERGGETQKGKNNERDGKIRAYIQSRLEADQIYKAALQDALDYWDEAKWGKRFNIERLRNRFPKNSFTTPDPS